MKLPLFLKYFIFVILLSIPFSVLAQESFHGFDGEVVISAAVPEDVYSTVEVLPEMVEIMQPAIVTVTLRDRNSNPLSNRYIQLVAEGLIFEQPSQPSNSQGKVFIQVYSNNVGTYQICAEDITYEDLVIEILDCATLYVTPVAVPTLLPEPYYTKGTTNNLFWNSLGTGYQYYIQSSKDIDFLTVNDSSDWFNGTMFKFMNLENEVMYFYRVRAKNNFGGVSSWSNIVFSVQDAEPPTIEIISISDLGDNTTKEWSSNFEIKFIYKVEDNLSLEEVQFFCLSNNGERYPCGHTVRIGVLYTTTVKLSELEKQSLNTLFDEYNFCIKAEDTAGNITEDCNIRINISPWGEVIDEEPPEEIPSYIIRRFTDFVDTTRIVIEDLFSNMAGEDLTGIGISTVFATFAVGLTTLLGGLIQIPIYFLQLLLNLLSWLGIRGKGKLSGYVYDSNTKEPITQAIIRVYSNTKKLVWTDVTDSRGEFALSLEDGSYKITVSANNYTFPSKIVFGKSDFPLENVYHGDEFEVKNGHIPNFSIPLDIEDLATIKKFSTVLKGTTMFTLKILGILLFLFGFIFSIYSYYITQTTFNFFLVTLYIPLFILIMRAFFKKDLRYGVVKTESGDIVSNVSIGLRDKDYGRIVSKRVTDSKGRYRFVTGEGNYKLEILDTEYELFSVEEKKPKKLSDGSLLVALNVIVKGIAVEK